jgi:hypothetical protein
MKDELAHGTTMPGGLALLFKLEISMYDGSKFSTVEELRVVEAFPSAGTRDADPDAEIKACGYPGNTYELESLYVVP